MSWLHCFLSSATFSKMFSFLVLLSLLYSKSSLAHLPSTFHCQLHHSPKHAVLIPYMTKPSQPHFPYSMFKVLHPTSFLTSSLVILPCHLTLDMYLSFLWLQLHQFLCTSKQELMDQICFVLSYRTVSWRWRFTSTRQGWFLFSAHTNYMLHRNALQKK